MIARLPIDGDGPAGGTLRAIGLDPGLRSTGWGVIEAEGNRLRFIACGTVRPDEGQPLAQRLAELHVGLMQAIANHAPTEAAVEETFVNVNPASTLKLGQARGVVLLAPARCGLKVAEYAANLVKKSVVGSGHADKAQIADMVRRLLPAAAIDSADAADALAVAICHVHHAQSAAARARRSAAGGGRS